MTATDPNRRCRAFIRVDGRLYATALVDPSQPSPRTIHQFQQIQEHWAATDPKKAVSALSSAKLQQRFHDEIGEWFSKTLSRRRELRHLIRVLFVWLLQERGIVPPDALWAAGICPADEDQLAVHRHIEWLFHELLAVPKQNRSKDLPLINTVGDQPWREVLIDTVPYLNGSLFTRLGEAERAQELANEMYLGNDGLLSILSRYDWTLSDRTGYASESAIDPAMLGDLFERLVLITDGVQIRGSHASMPGGTYYTPQDIADEMTSDALAGWLAPRVGGGVKDLRELVHPSHERKPWLSWDESKRERVRELLRGVTVLDPCCGSGVFTLSVLQALCRAQERLGNRRRDAQLLESILERQVHAVDIHPMAVLVTRLRLYIALAEVRSGATSPLPNLETRCIAADALSVDLQNQMDLLHGGAEFERAMGNWRAAREMWTSAHEPEEKLAVEAEIDQARSDLKARLGRGFGANTAWLDADYKSDSAVGAEVDLRMICPAPRQGWDIVLGNPPYQPPSQEQRKRARRLGFEGTKNLYLLFIEVALGITRPDGFVCLIVPHSIVFGRTPQDFSKVRDRIERVADRIDVSIFDNRPQPVFPRLPWLPTGQENRQRVAVLGIRKAVQSAIGSEIFSSGLLRLEAATRALMLRSPKTRVQQPIDKFQWLSAPSEEMAELLGRMRGEARASDEDGKVITFPATAMYFLTCLPKDTLQNQSRKEYSIPDDSLYWPWVGLYNSRLFHAYWLMVGDAFHVTAAEYATVAAPAGWKCHELRTKCKAAARASLGTCACGLPQGPPRSRWRALAQL